MLNGDVHSHGVGDIHFVGLGLEPEGEFVEMQFQSLFERPKSSSPIAVQYKIEILGRAGAPSETQFHRDAALEIVAAENSLECSPFEYAADREERHPSPQSLLIDTLFAGDARQRFFQPLRRRWPRCHRFARPSVCGLASRPRT